MIYGTLLYALDNPHNINNTVNCADCHVSSPPANWWTDQESGLCASCHNDIAAVFEKTHSSTSMGSAKYGIWERKCTNCHNPHYQRQSRIYKAASYLYSGISTGVTATTLTKAGAGWTGDQWKGMVILPNVSYTSLNYRIASNTSDTITIDTGGGDAINLTYIKPGSTFAIVYGRLVREYVSGKTVKFFRDSGANSFADGDATRDGICEVCHTKPSHFRYDGSGSDQLHTNIGGTAGSDCTVCHPHIDGFGHGGGADCIACHGHDAGYEYESGKFSQGKGSFKSHSTHTENDTDDIKGPNLTCGDCHDTGSYPRFKDGQELSGTTVCSGCHSAGGTYDGVNNSVIGAKVNWDAGIYENDSVTLKAGKVKWCATCHDESPSVINAVSAPNVIGDENGAYTYGAGWGYYMTGHGLSSSEKYPASGGVTAGADVQCNGCHDFSTAHIDGLARTFDDGESEFLDPSYYRQGYRLKMVGGLEPMLVPVPGTTANSADNYRLCVACHASGVFVDSGNMNTNFRTKLGAIDPELNRHEYHLRSTGFGKRASSDWSNPVCTGGSTGSCNSRITCTTCHNVHGSTRLAMVRDGKLVNREPGLKIWYYNTDIVSFTSPPETEPTPQDVPLSASTGTVWSAGSSDNLCSHCHGNDWLTTETRIPFQDVTQAPTLAWTGEANYTSDGVNPNSGASGSNFVFRVKYTDTNNEAPAVKEVWVDTNDNGTYEAGEKYDMTEVDPGDTNYTDGKLYTKTLSLSKAGDNTFNYRFYASNSLVATGPPTSDKTVTVTNNVPILTWTGEAYFISDGVNPDTGGNGSAFEFRVNYTDLDNEAPTSMKVWVDENDNGTYEAGEKYSMTTVDGGDTNYTDGKLYTKSLNLVYAGDGNLNYRFYAGDGIDNATGSPASDSMVTVLFSSNTPPALDWTAGNCLSNGVRPAIGATGADFEFLVEYTDADNDPPSAIEVWVDANDNGSYEVGEKYAMTEVDAGDIAYTDGKLYKYSGAVSYAGDGILNHRFYATDGTDEAAGLPTSNSTLTVVNTTYKVRPTGGSGWYSTIADALTGSPASSTVLVYPNNDFTAATYAGGLSNINKTNRTLQSVCGADLTIISGGTTVFALQGNDGAVIDGFSITGGTTNGISANADSLTIKNCKIYSNATGVYLFNVCNPVSIQNTSVYSNTSYGINSSNTGSLISISDSSIYNNSGGSGAGISLNGGAGAHTIANSLFTGNAATTNGGGIYCNACTMTIDDSIFNSNTAGAGGAIYLLNDATATITDTFIQGNSVTGSGGGINNATATSHAIMTNVMITGNKAASNGGAIYEGGYTDCLFCTISGNYAGNLAGAIYHLNSVTTTVKNSIVYNNDAANQPNYKQIYAVGSRWQYVDIYNTLINQVPGSASYPYGYESMGGNLHEDTRTDELPYFLNGLNPSSAPATNGDYRICGGLDDPPGSGCGAASWCIDAGSSSYTYDHDIFGGARPLGAGYDMGAHEKE